MNSLARFWRFTSGGVEAPIRSRWSEDEAKKESRD